MAPAGEKASKPIFKTDSPFTETTWPHISGEDQEIILDLLCSLLEPIGHHRRTHIRPSKGRKRKRQPKPAEETAGDGDTKEMDTTPPPAPEVNKHILVGLNSVTRHLSELAARNAPPTMPIAQTQGNEEAEDSKPQERKDGEDGRMKDGQGGGKETKIELRPLSLVILTHSPHTFLAHAHLPTLIYLSTIPSNPKTNPTITSTPSLLDQPSLSANRTTRLVALATSSESKLASALHIPRVGAIGILEDAPGADALVGYVQDNVGPVECRWLEEALEAVWKGVKTKIQMS